jgi:hypothetical protein
LSLVVAFSGLSMQEGVACDGFGSSSAEADDGESGLPFADAFDV